MADCEEHDPFRSHTTSSTTSPPPPPIPSSSSPPSSSSSKRLYSPGSVAAAFRGTLKGEAVTSPDFRSSPPGGAVPVSPMCNGYNNNNTSSSSSSSPCKSKDEMTAADVQSSGGEHHHEERAREGFSSNPSPSSNKLLPPPPPPVGVKEGKGQDEGQAGGVGVAMVKQEGEEDQDGPLDFSVKRRDSLVSESFTDDSRASSASSSSISPSSYSGVGMVVGAGGGGYQGGYSSSTSLQPSPPESEHLHPAASHLHSQHQHLLSQRPSHRHHSGSNHSAGGDSAAEQFHKRPPPPRLVGRSPTSSPDHADLIGQPKTASGKIPVGGGSRSPVNASLAALGMMAEGGGGVVGAGGMTPAALVAMSGQNGGGGGGGGGMMGGPLGNLPAAFMTGDFRKLVGNNGGKVQRPFKAYPKEALQMPLGYLGLPGINPFPGLDFTSMQQGLSLSQEEIMSLYKQQLEFMKEREKQMAGMGKLSNRSPPSSSSSSSTSNSTSSTSSSYANGSNNSSSMVHPTPPLPPLPPPAPPSMVHPPHHPGAHQPLPPSSSSVSAAAAAAAAASSFFPPQSPSSAAPPHLHNASGYGHIPNSASSTSSSCSSHFPTPTVPPLVSSTSSISGSGSRKRPRSLPDSEKDDAYWERRRKNNDAAKRSRDARRAKEDEIALRAALLEQENLKLRVEVAALKTETARLRCMLYNS